MAAEDAVAQLLCVHLGLLDENELPDDAVRDFRDLYRLPLRSFGDKCALMSAAEATGCSAVILDVLLFVSETMAPALFRKQLAALPLSLSQWVHYLVEQCMVTNETVSLSALRGLLDLYAATQRYRELAAMLLSLVFYDRELSRSLKVTDDVLDIAKFYRHRFPVWILDLLHEYVALSKLQLQTEQEDANTAPEVRSMAANLDKRARGVGNLQANWRMRYIQLTEKEIVYFKHEEGKLHVEKSKNPFHDKTGKGNKKGSLPLARGMKIEPLDYRGKFSLRPYCVKICDAAGNEELILDSFSPEVQRQWVAAITANVKRLELDPRWLAFPRRCVHRMTVGEFLRYSMLYHGDAKKSHTRHSSCQPGPLREQFNIDPKRYLFSALVTCALVRDWNTMEALVQPRSAKSTIISLFPSGNSGRLATASAPASSSAWSSTPAPAPSRYSVWSNSTDPVPSSNRSSAPSNVTAPPPVPAPNTTVQGMVDASAIGYGAILDIAEQRHAPPNLLMVLEALHEKNESKRGWSCRREADASDAASMKITIAIPESVRADTNWE
ncbi:Pleckstrin homology domain-containing protein [Phytophthora infestans]|uniref:Pleckstrin homology domain-containing protein n=1 Tax=Phytophthora infestans TaxID=4787 RepID=A0A833SU40_PHYIN|nr:Pleckstrin homology domain-containing protein [Phytophthora infestans]